LPIELRAEVNTDRVGMRIGTKSWKADVSWDGSDPIELLTAIGLSGASRPALRAPGDEQTLSAASSFVEATNMRAALDPAFPRRLRFIAYADRPRDGDGEQTRRGPRETVRDRF
jgi:hypothetical protein